MPDGTRPESSHESAGSDDTEPAGETALSVDGLTKTFGSLVAVDDLDLSIRRGEIHGLIGPNGAGKTTTINLITGELEPTSGAVRFEGEDIVGLPPSAIAHRGIGRSFQVVQYFPALTVEDHLHLAMRDSTRTVRSVLDREADHTERIREVAALVQLGDKLDTVAKNLSHGEQRYLDIGMVLALDSELIVFDEPAAGLNTAETEDLEGIIRDLRGEYTIVIIEHDIDLVRRLVDRISVLHNGTRLATGTPEEIVANEEVREVYLGE